jgi:hypothetical protein
VCAGSRTRTGKQHEPAWMKALITTAAGAGV